MTWSTTSKSAKSTRNRQTWKQSRKSLSFQVFFCLKEIEKKEIDSRGRGSLSPAAPRAPNYRLDKSRPRRGGVQSTTPIGHKVAFACGTISLRCSGYGLHCEPRFHRGPPRIAELGKEASPAPSPLRADPKAWGTGGFPQVLEREGDPNEIGACVSAHRR